MVNYIELYFLTFTRSLSSRPVIIYVDEPRGSQILFTLLPGGETSTNAYVGVKHFATPKQNTSHVLSRFEIVPNKVFCEILFSGYNLKLFQS